MAANQAQSVYLPPQPTSFIGRQKEVVELATLLADPACRLLSLVGPGGSGKTRLAIEVARRCAANFTDGALFVGLESLQATEDIALALATVLGLPLRRAREPREQALDFLRHKNMLLLFDNMEHLLVHAEIFSVILDAAPGVKILVTTRETLKLREEWPRYVRGLEYPRERPVRALEQYSAAQLFCERLRQGRGDFRPDEEAQAVLQICRLTEGLPLALELAAGWGKTLPCHVIAREIQESLDFLQTRLRNVPERHRSMRVIFDWSWGLLERTQRESFMKLAAFRGGFTWAAAAAITGISLEALADLVEKSLLRMTPSGRYELHELLWQYAAERLEESGLMDEAAAAHSSYFLNWLSERRDELKGRGQMAALDAIEADFENLRRAWNFAIARADASLIDAALESLYLFGWMRTRTRAAEELIQAALKRFSVDNNPALYGRLLARSIIVDPDNREVIETALALVRQYSNRAEIALCLYCSGWIAAHHEGDPAQARALLEACLDEFRALEDWYYMARVLSELALLYLYDGQRAAAAACYQEATRALATGGDQYSRVWHIGFQVALSLLDGDYKRATAFKREQLALLRQNNNQWGTLLARAQQGLWDFFVAGEFRRAEAESLAVIKVASEVNIPLAAEWARVTLGMMANVAGDYAKAQELLQSISARLYYRATLDCGLAIAAYGLGQAARVPDIIEPTLAMAIHIDGTGWITWCLPACFLWLVAREDHERAVELLGLLLTHPTSPQGWLMDWPLLRQLRAELQEQLGAEVYAAAWQRGCHSDLDAVARGLLAEFGSKATPQEDTNQQLTEPLTGRELEVLSCVAEGLSNREIAERLFIGLSTVKKHITNIFAKLGAKNRTQALNRARELRLL